MNIQTVAENLRNTIAGKEKYLAKIRSSLSGDLEGSEYAARVATGEFLEINIDELKRILQDVEQCEDQLAADAR